MTQVPQEFHMEAEIQGIQVLEDLIEELEDELAYLQGGMQSSNTVWAIKVARLKRERLKALAAMSKSKLLFADLELFVAENELHKLTDKNNTQRYDKYLRNTTAQRNQRYTPYRRSNSSITSSNVSPDSTITGGFYHSSPKENTPNKNPVDISTQRNVSLIEMSESLKHLSPKLRDNSPRSNSPKELSSKSSVSCQTNSSSDMNKTSSTVAQSTVSTTLTDTLTMSKSPVNTSGSNKSLTDSIIAEFNRPYWNINSRSNGNAYSSTLKPSIPQSSVLRKRSQNVKINPVSNIEAYKNAHAQKSLTYKSHLLYTPNKSSVRAPLHPKDPRASNISLESIEKPMPQTPMSLPVPSMVKNKDVYTPPKKFQQSNQASNVSNQTRNGQHSAHHIAKRVDSSHISAVGTSPYPRLRSTSTPVKQIENIQESDTYTESESESMSVPTCLSMLKYHDHNKSNQTQVTPPKRPENRQVFVPTIGGNVEHRPLPVSTPQKWFENKHICVPLSPLYNHGIRPYVVGQNSTGEMNSSQKIDPNSNFNMKENRRPNSPKRVCFYHSS